MSAITSKAIVITAFAGKHGTITVPGRNAEFTILDSSADYDSDDSSTSNSGGGAAPKKRRRLTHLSPDEKLLRRKLKNRVAAQTARDRKKALMAELEEKVSKLEEENKLLKRQNYTLKEASTTLAKENAALKSQLADHPVPTIKTDSETIRSAAPAVPPQKEQFQILSRWMAQYITVVVTLRLSDDFLGLLQELAEDSKCEQSQAQTTTPFPQDISGGDCTDHRSSANHRTSSPRVVGLTPAELESLNELISIDHIYVKSQPITSQKGKEGQHKFHAPVGVHGQNASIISSQQKVDSSILGSKRKHCEEVGSQTVSLVQPNIPAHPPSRESQTLNHSATDDFTLSSYLSPESLSSLQSNDPGIADDFITSLSDSDVESSLNLFQDLDFSTIESSFKPVTSEDMRDSKNDICMNFQYEPFAADMSESEINTSRLFAEIYGHYLNIPESSPLDCAALSDSGVSSDIDPLSPRSTEESYHDDMWHDTSFADLFPGLQ